LKNRREAVSYKQYGLPAGARILQNIGQLHPPDKTMTEDPAEAAS